MNIRYRVTLEIGKREVLVSMVSGGKVSARRLKRAQILLAADRGFTDEVKPHQLQRAHAVAMGGSGR